MIDMHFYKNFNMLTAQDWTYNPTASNETSLVLDSTRSNTLTYGGSFDYAGGEAFGSINYGAYTSGGETVYDFTPLEPLDANAILALLESGDAQAYYSYLLREDDYLIGQDGRQVLYGYDGNDWMTGGKGNDTLYGGAGNDRLSGSEGDDVLRGGAGHDDYVFDQKNHGIDTIDGFNINQDTIVLYSGWRGAPFNHIGSGTLDADFFRANVGGNAEDSNDRILFDTETGAVYYDADANGAGAKVQFALVGVSNGDHLSAENFQVVIPA